MVIIPWPRLNYMLTELAVENTTEGDLVVEHVIGFVSETAIHSIKRATDDTIGHWFHDVR
jgi:histone deacetylase 6